MATHFSILAWRIPWTEEPGGPQSMGSQRAGHDWSDLACMRSCFRDPTFKGEKVYISCPVFEWTVLNVSSHPLPHLATWKPYAVEIFLSSWEGGEVPGKVGGSWEANSFPQLLGMCLVEVQHVAVGILWGSPDSVFLRKERLLVFIVWYMSNPFQPDPPSWRSVTLLNQPTILVLRLYCA